MITLDSKQRQHLRSLANPLKAVVNVGKEGITPTVVQSVQDAFNNRELLKVKVLESAPQDAREIGEAIAAGIPDVVLVATIGRTAILYRPHPKRPEIELPRGAGKGLG